MPEERPILNPRDQSQREDLGGERACLLDEVCINCGAIGGHRPGCELAEPEDELVTEELELRPGERRQEED